MRPGYLCSLFSLCLLLACSSKNMFPEKYKGDQIILGVGGGITGEVTSYVVLENGKVFTKTKDQPAPVYHTTLNSPFVSQMFENFKLLNLSEYTFNEPGNRYYFIHYITKGDISSQMTWGSESFDTPDKVTTYYSILMNTINPSK